MLAVWSAYICLYLMCFFIILSSESSILPQHKLDTGFQPPVGTAVQTGTCECSARSRIRLFYNNNGLICIAARILDYTHNICHAGQYVYAVQHGNASSHTWNTDRGR